MMKDRRSDYDRQTRAVRLYRWLRWMPLAYVKGCWYMLVAVFSIVKTLVWVDMHCDEIEAEHGIEVNRLDYFWDVFWSPWQCAISRSQYSMGRCRSLDDLIEELYETAAN